MPLARIARRSPIALAVAIAAVALAAGAAPARTRSVAAAGVVHAHPAGAAHRAGRGARSRPIRYADPGRLLKAKRSAFRRYRRAVKRAHRGRRAARVRFRGNVFAGLNAQGFAFASAGDSNYVSPPDPTGAIGPSHYVQFTNGGIVVYARSTLTPVAGGTSTLEDFVGLPSSATAAGDPQIQWDPVAQRWYYLAYATNADNSANFLMWGWSKTASPATLDSSGWCKFELDTGPVFPDFAKLGHDDTHLIFGANGFDGIEPISALVYVFSKPPNGDMTCPVAPSGTQFGSATAPLATQRGVPADTPVPANTLDPYPRGYIVAADAPNALMVWHVADGATGPDLVADGDLTVPSFAVPANAPQPGTANVLDTLDGRLTQAVAHADPGAGGAEVIWTQHTVAGPGGRSAVRWYEIVPSAPAVRQRGTLTDPANFLFNGAIAPTTDGRSAAIVYNASGRGLAPAVRVSVRRRAAPPGTFGFPLAMASSGSSLDDFSCEPPTPNDPPICRWGDYAGATPDPANSNVVWASQEYSGGSRWLTRNFAIEITQAGPTAKLSAAPNPATAGKPVTVDGAASSDPVAPIRGYSWDLDGNGSFETGTGATPRVVHTYRSAATLTVRLRIVDANGDLSDAATTLTVKPPPGPTPACKAAIKKRKQLEADIKRLKKRLNGTTDPQTRRSLQKKLNSKRSQLKKARAAETKACKA